MLKRNGLRLLRLLYLTPYYISSGRDIPNDVTLRIVIDNGQNLRAAVRRLAWVERACLANKLQLSIFDVMVGTPSAAAGCKGARSVVDYKHSPSASHKLDTLMDQLKGHKLRLVLDVPTRGNS